MDDFDYSLHISDQDWDTFYQECEACNLLSPGLASREDSGMSDIDEMGSHLLDLTRLPASAEADLDSPPDCEGSPVDNYLSKYGIRSPEQVLSGSEEDLHLQTVNLFFEQLKSVTVNEQSHAASCQNEKMDHLAGLIDKQVIQSIGICPSGRNAASLKGEITKQGEADTWGSTALEKPIMATFTNAQARASDSTEREPVVGGGSLSSQLITVGMKQEQEKRCYHLSCTESTELKQKPETKPPDKPKMANWTNVTDLNPAGESIAQLSPSNLRRKRRKKKRMSSEPGEPGHGYEAQFRVHQSESEEERFIQREVINSLPTHFLQREHSSLPRVKMSSVSFNNDNLPLSFTTFGFDTKPQVGCTSMYNISKNTNDIPLVNNGQLKAEVCQKSTLPQMDIVLHIQENYVEVNPIQTDSALQLRDTPSIKETLSESQSDKSATGCQRKSLLSPNISTAADSTEPLSSSVTLNLAEGACKDVSCMGNEIDCCAFNSEQSSPSKWKMTWTSDTQQSNFSMTENIDETESCLDGNSPKTFSQKGELVPPTDIQTFKISTDNSLGKIKSKTKCCMPENPVVCDHGTDEGPIQSMNNSSEISFVNTSLIQPENLTEESEEKRSNGVNKDDSLYHAVEDKSIGELGDETTSSSEHIHGLKIPEDLTVSDHGNDESYIQQINNSSEVIHINSSLIKQGSLTEELENKEHSNVNEGVNMYHAVEEKSIGELSDNTTSSSEHMHGLKIPEHTSVSDHGKNEGHIQSIDYSSEILIANTSLIQPENLTEESEDKRCNTVKKDAHLFHAVEDKSIGELCDETTRSSEHIHGLNIPDNNALCGNGKDGDILSINNSREISIVNTSLIQPENCTEESKGKRYNGVNEDANLYHAVEEKSIGELRDKTTSSSEHINGLKIPEDPAVSDHGNDESHIQQINNISEVLNINSSLIKQGSLTEELENKVHSNVNEGVNIYHAVEEKSISMLSDNPTSSSEYINGLKMPEDPAVSDHGNNESHIQQINNSSEVLNRNLSLIKPESLTEESESKVHSSVNEYVNLYHAVEEKIIGELSDETTSSSEHIHGLKIPEDPAVFDNGKDESHIQHINNHSEVLNMNSSLKKTRNLTEDSESKGHSSVNEDDNLYHAVEKNNIGELSDKTTSLSEHIHGLKIPEHTSVSDHETFEGHIQSINNSSEILIANTSLIQPENSTEESKSKGHNSGTEDANLYHAVEEKSIGELSDKTTSSSEHINGLKMPEDPAVSDHRKDEGHIQSINNSSEISIVNTSLIQPENSTEESKGKRYNGVNEDANLYHAVEDKSIGELCDETTRSSEHIHGVKIPEHIAVSDHGNDEGHIQHINNNSEVLNMKSSLIKPGNSTEESESKGHNSVNEDVNLYHAVEERIIGELCDETTRSRENICGLKMPEHISVSDHGKDESHIQSTNCNSSEVLNMNTVIIKPGNSTEESEVKGHNSVSEEDKSIGELCNLTSTSSESTCDHKKEMEMLSEDSTQNALADVSDSKSIDPESIVLNAPNQTPCPVYAISSFWNEMEKLTINDILRLRMIANAQHPSVLTQPEDGSIADATDAADSGYFTQPDDSKPDRLSEDMSFISDLDEDFTLQTPDCIKQEESSCELPSSPCSVTWQNDSDPAIVGDNVVFVSSETIVPENLCKSNTQQCFRKICKNISVQNLQALESQPIRQMLRNPSLHSIHSEVEDPFYHVNTSYATCLSDDEEVDSGGISFSEIIQYFLGDYEPERCPSPADNAESYPRSFFSPFEDESSGKDKIVPIFSCNRSGNHQFPEAYDYFFPDSPLHSDEDDESDNASTKVETHKSTYPFEVESGEKDEVVPIFSCTRSRKHQFPEAYDYFFPDSPVHSDEDDESDSAPIKVVTHNSANHYPVAKLDMCEESNPVQSSFFWSNLFSFRRVRCTAPSIPEEKSYSWALTPVKPLRKGIKSVTVMGPDDKPFPDTLYLNLENNILLQLTEQQKKCMEMQTVIADPRLDAPFLPLRQADMCLVCIAFASWVLKSANPGADTWKAALLANISALSAIRYLRRHKREEASLRQIEPA